MVAPADVPDGVAACLSKVIAGVLVSGAEFESVAATGAPTGGVPDAVAVLLTTPESTSAWVRV